MTHSTGSTAMISTASAEWILLRVLYHYVLAQSPSPESAKITISTARRNGQLRLRAEVREHEVRDLKLSPGEQPPEIQPKRNPDQPILASDKFSTWDWERSYATRRDATTKSLFEYMEIVGNRDDVLELWPPAEMTVTSGDRPKAAETALAKPVDVSRLVWAVVLTLDNMEKQTPTGLAGFTQQQLTETVSTRLPRHVSQRTLQKAVAVRRKRNGATN